MMCAPQTSSASLDRRPLVPVYATCNISGGHLNPAVTFANCLTGHMSWSRGGTYVTAQILGGIFGALIEVQHISFPCNPGYWSCCPDYCNADSRCGCAHVTGYIWRRVG